MKTKFIALLIALVFSLLTACDNGSSSDSGGGQKNLPPIFISTAPAIAQINVAYTYNYRAVDVDSDEDDTLTVTANDSDTCGGAVVDAGDGTGSYIFTPDASQVDTQCVVGLTVSDDDDDETEQNTTVNIGDENAAPYFTSTVPDSADEGVLYTYDISAADDNVPAQALTITVAVFDGCGGAVTDNGDGTAAYEFTPDEYQGGSECIVGVVVTDSMGASADQYSIVAVAEDNNAPSFTSSAPTVAVEDELYLYSANVSDPDFPLQNLVCSVNGSDTCGGELSDCVYMFTPTESDGGSDCVVGLTVTDDGDPALTADQNTTVTIGEVNSPPSFVSTAPTAATEDALYSYTAFTYDPDDPAQTLTCSVNVSDTCGGTLAGCVYSFTPTESEGGTNCVVGLTVTDDGSPVLSASQNTTVGIAEANTAPSFTSSANTSAVEDVLYTYSITVTDSDLPAQTLTISKSVFDTCGGTVLDSGAGAGTYSFTPDEYQGGAQCLMAVTTTDSWGTSVSQYTMINVTENNKAPSFSSSAPTDAVEDELYLYSANADDPDFPLQNLACSINGSDTCGGELSDCVYMFTPTESEGDTDCVVGLTVTDDGSPALTADQNTTVSIAEVNSPPSFVSTAPTGATEGVLYTYAANVYDSDDPSQTLTCSKSVSDTCGGTLVGCTYTFTPTELQGGTGCLVGLTVTDNGSPVLGANQNSTIYISEVNSQPAITSSAPTTATEDALYTYSATVSDSDLPAQTLTCSVSPSDSCGGSLAGCVYTFTPTETQGGGNCVVGLRVSDNGIPILSADQNITVSVAETNLAPSFTSIAPTVATEATLFTYSATVSDLDIPAQNLTCSINVSDTCGGTLTGCAYSFTPTESQGGAGCVMGLTVTDDGSPVLSANQNTTVNVTETNQTPSITSSAPTTASEGVLYSYAASVSDSDTPTQTLTCSKNSSDTCNGTVSSCTYSFTPSESQGGGNCIVGLRVTDNGSPNLYADQNTTVAISEVNSAPSFTSTAPTTATEGVMYSYASSVSDSDTPTQTLTCSKTVSDTCGGTLSSCAYSFTPSESQGGANCVVGLRVTDNGSPNLFTNQNTTVSISEVNSTPTWTTAPTNITIAMGNSYNQTNGQASDSDLPAQTLTCSNAGSDCSFTVTVSGSGSGLANCNVSIPTITASETCDLDVRVSDGAGGTITETITISAEGCLIYVNDNASGSNNGSSWTNAYTNIQTAMDAASSGCQLWVAGGTYANSPASSVSVLMMEAGVQAYGGFAGTETALSQRTNPSGNASVLDGGNTSFHVVTMASNTRLDGFTVINGKALGIWNVTGSGGGVFSQSVSNVYVTNCIIRNNSAQWYGGGIELIGASSVTIENDLLYSNAAQQGGGLDTDTVVNVRNCTFVGNNATDQGGGIDVYATNPIITNCIIWGNTATVGYPGIYPQPNGSTPAVPVVTYSDVQDGYAGTGNANSDPLFAAGTYGSYYLTQATSPCVNTGSASAASLGFDSRTTSPANAADSGTVDMGFHYFIP